MRFSVAFLVVAVLAAVSLGQPQVQQKTGASENKRGNALAMAAFAGQQSSQNPSQPPQPSSTTRPPQKQETRSPRPAGKVTAPKPIPCSQRLKAQVNSNEELSKRVAILEGQNTSWQNLANDLTSKLRARDELVDQQQKLIEQQQETNDKQRKLLEQYSAVSAALAGEMMSSDVSGNWTIQTPTGRTICYVQLFEVSHTIQLTNCHY